MRERQWSVEFLFGDKFDDLAGFFFRRHLDDGPGRCLTTEFGGDVGSFALDHVVVSDQVGEDVPVEAVGFSGVEGSV